MCALRVCVQLEALCFAAPWPGVDVEGVNKRASKVMRCDANTAIWLKQDLDEQFCAPVACHACSLREAQSHRPLIACPGSNTALLRKQE